MKSYFHELALQFLRDHIEAIDYMSVVEYFCYCVPQTPDIAALTEEDLSDIHDLVTDAAYCIEIVFNRGQEVKS